MTNESSSDISSEDISKGVQTLVSEDNDASVQTPTNVNDVVLLNVQSADDVRTTVLPNLAVVTSNQKESCDVSKGDFLSLDRNAMQNVRSMSNQPHSSNRTSFRPRAKRRGDPTHHSEPKRKSRKAIINNIYYGKLRNLVKPSSET
ncbi:PREDICTED: uncharacterized protein LOC106101563 [Papilio polytes]|uniref:uncharacterized protein LOC106101563 n=1 Tax=Papilio polytes TaxID=76194 RepID=UPI0006766A0D|nr:PREDICTED: uncharacterized protein LOC106101563 [Papilio polytes]